MFYNRKNMIALLFISILCSCYHKELQYSYDTSSGGVVVGSSFFYLAKVREFQIPKGISRFPDGGMSRDIRQLFGVFKTDTLSNSTILVARLGDVVGWPSRFSTRIGKNSNYIAIGIMNVTMPDSINGIYLYSLNNEKLNKYINDGALPALSNSGTYLAYCIRNRLYIDDCSSKTTLYSYLLNFDPVFVSWKSEDEIYLFLSNPFKVKILNISTGKTTDTDLKYIKNYNQEIDINKIIRTLRKTSSDPKEILDKYY